MKVKQGKPNITIGEEGAYHYPGDYSNMQFRTLYFGPSRTFIYNCGPTGVEPCPSCGKYAVSEALLCSTFPDEPKETSYGRKCLWCSWTGPCEEKAA